MDLEHCENLFEIQNTTFMVVDDIRKTNTFDANTSPFNESSWFGRKFCLFAKRYTCWGCRGVVFTMIGRPRTTVDNLAGTVGNLPDGQQATWVLAFAGRPGYRSQGSGDASGVREVPHRTLASIYKCVPWKKIKIHNISKVDFLLVLFSKIFLIYFNFFAFFI